MLRSNTEAKNHCYWRGVLENCALRCEKGNLSIHSEARDQFLWNSIENPATLLK